MKGFRKRMSVGFGLMALLTLTVVGYSYYSIQKGLNDAIDTKLDDLKTINDFKTTQINDWLNERLADARHFSTSPLYADAICMALNGTRSTPDMVLKISDRNEMIRSLRGFSDVQIVSWQHQLMYSTDNTFRSLHDHLLPMVDSCLRSSRILLTHLVVPSAKSFICTLSPITTSDGQTCAVMVFYINPETYIYPTLGFKPSDMKGLTSALVDLDLIDDVDSLNNHPYYRAIAHGDGQYFGADLHGDDIMAFYCPLGNAPWVVVSSLPVRQLRNDFYKEYAPIFFIQMLMLGMVLFFVWWQMLRSKQREISRLAAFRQAVLESAGHAIITTDTSGIITSINKAGETLLGYAADELIGKSSPLLFHVRDELMDSAARLSRVYHRTIEPGFDVFVDEARQGLVKTHEWHYVKKDGSTVPVNLTVSSLLDSKGNVTGYMGVAVDLTEVKNAEQKFSHFYNLSPDMVGISRLSDGTFMDVNPAFCTILGYNYDEIIGHSSLAMGIWVCPDERQELLRLVNEKGYVQNFEFQLAAKNGDRLAALFSARRFMFRGDDCLLFVVRDITERKKAEEEAQHNRKRLDSLLRVLQHPCDNVSTFLDDTLNEAIAITQSQIGYIYYYDDDRQVFNLNSWSRNVMPECTIADPATCYELDKTGLWGEVVRQQKPILINDFAAHNPLKKGYPPGHVPLRNFLSIPVWGNDHIVAVIGVANKEGDYSHDDILQLTLLMDTAWKVVEKQKSQQALADSEQKYRKLFENMTSGLVLHRMIYNRDKQPVDFQFMEINPAASQILEIDAAATKGRLFNEVFVQDRNREWLNQLGNVDVSGQTLQFIDFNGIVNKYIEWNLFRYMDGYVVAVMNDVTSRVMAERELKLSEEKLKLIYEMVPDAIGLSRLSDGVILDANPSFTHLTGYSPEEYVNKSTNELDLWVNPYQRDALVDILRRDGELKDYVIDMRIKDGSVLNCIFSFKLIRYNDEDCILFVIHDMTAIRLAEKALRDEQTFINTLLDSVPGLVYLYDEAGRLIRWNRKFVSDTGFNDEELENKTVRSWFDDKNWAIVEKVLGFVFSEGSGEVEAYLTLKDGSQRLYYFSASAGIIGGRSYLAGIALDITEKKMANESLRQVEQRFQNIYNLSPDMVGITRQSDGKIMSINPATTILTGYSMDECMGHTSVELNWWANADDRDEMLRRLKTTGEVSHFETGMRVKDGSLLTCVFNARPLLFNNEECLLFVVHDITELKRKEELLRIHRDRLQKAQTVGHIGYSEWEIGSPYFWASAEAKRIFGYEPVEGFIPMAEVVGCFADEVARLKMARQALLEEGKAFDIEYRITPADGSGSRYIHSIQDVEYNEAGEPIKIVDVFQDITERKKIELEILHINENLEKTVEERTDQLAKANRDLEAFAYSVSHDLRAPIRHIDGFFKLLFNQISQPSPTIVNYAEKINAASQRMSAMIDELLAFSRLGRKALLMTRVDLNEVVKEIIDQLSPDIATRLVHWQIDDLPVVVGDRSLLKTAIENLIGNSVKYTRQREEAVIVIGQPEPKVNMQGLFVRDNGVGFDMAYRDKLFGVFQRLHTNEEFEGTGIGLANVKQIVTRHGGEIEAMGKVDEGAEFRIYLPSGVDVL
ncbi:MAG: PAS domain S-box protein [Marinilabiliaceae bacterium]|nr:PAS domain S-box protein [Marinilabiliaceae bacterium]